MVRVFHATQSPTFQLSGYIVVRFLIWTASSFFGANLNCIDLAFDHRDHNNILLQAEMLHLPCTTRFHIYEPIKEYRTACPYILVVVHGAHSHPIPLPKTTPPLIRGDIFRLLENLNEDLPDITPRSFLRHPTVQSYLRTKLPNVNCPTLSDIHISLANRSHLKAYITQVTAQRFPKGTGWEG